MSLGVLGRFSNNAYFKSKSSLLPKKFTALRNSEFKGEKNKILDLPSTRTSEIGL